MRRDRELRIAAQRLAELHAAERERLVLEERAGIAEHGARLPGQADQDLLRLRARLPTAEESSALELPAGVPVMHVIHVARADDGTILEVSESLWPADRIMVIDDYDVEPTAIEPESPSQV